MNEFEKLLAGVDRAALTGQTDEEDQAFGVLVSALWKAWEDANRVMGPADVLTGFAMFTGHVVSGTCPQNPLGMAEILHGIVADIIRRRSR